MRPHPWTHLDRYRIRSGDYASPPGETWGAFVIHDRAQALRVIASNATDGSTWEHVSVSLSNRCPNWGEMSLVKTLFWRESETVIQIHPPASVYVNYHPHTLHLWRPAGLEIPLPPSWMVGPRPGQTMADALREGEEVLGPELPT